MLTVCPQATDVVPHKIVEQHLQGTTRDHDLCGGMWIKQAMCVKTLYPCLSSPRLPFQPTRQPGTGEGLFYVFVEIEKELGSKENTHTFWTCFLIATSQSSLFRNTLLSPLLCFPFQRYHITLSLSPLSPRPCSPLSPVLSGCAATPHPRC